MRSLVLALAFLSLAAPAFAQNYGAYEPGGGLSSGVVPTTTSQTGSNQGSMSASEITDGGSGVQIGSPTGGAKGAGTINLAGGCFVNNVACGGGSSYLIQGTTTSALATSTSTYATLSGNAQGGTQNLFTTVSGVTGHITAMYAAPVGTTQAVTVTLWQNGSATSVTCTTTGSTPCEWDSTALAISATDQLGAAATNGAGSSTKITWAILVGP